MKSALFDATVAKSALFSATAPYSATPCMIDSSVSHVSHGEFVLQREIRESMLQETVARQRKRERQEKVQWSVLQSRCQGKVDGTVLGVILFRLTENSVLMDEISEKTWNEELNKLFLVKNSAKRKFNLTEFDMEIQNLERRNSECALIESRRELESQRRELLLINGRVRLTSITVMLKR